MTRRGIESTILISLAILVVAMMIALAARGNGRLIKSGPGPAPP